MSIVTADLVKRGAASRPEDDVSTSGGALDDVTVLDVTQMGSTSTLEAVSDNAADTMNLTLTGRDAGGAIVSEVRALNGTTPVVFSTNTLERFLKAVLASAAAGTVTIRLSGAGATVVTLPPAKTAASILFINSASESGITVRYEKEFWKNEHGTLTLTSAIVKLTADPSSSIMIAVALTKNDSGSVTNRKTQLGGLTWFDDAVSAAIPGDTLEAGAAIGVWIEMTRGASAAALKSSYTTELSGQST